MTAPVSDRGPALSGLRVLELAQVIAGPMAGSFLADFGADVVHVESPGVGDPARYTGITKDGVYLWWKVTGRNKRSVTIDLRQPAGQELARRLCKWADVVITSFRADTLTSWGLDWKSLHRVNPKLIMLQISGFGTNTTAANRPGFGKVGEAMSGVVHLTGFPDGPPVHTGFSHGDSVSGLFGAFAIQTALYRRETDPAFDGEWIDLALFEALFRLCEWQVIFYDQTGSPPLRAGNRLANAPAAVINTYLSSDQKWVTVTTGTWRSVQTVAALLGEPAEDYDAPQKQLDKSDHLDRLLQEYVGSRTAEDALAAMHAAEITASLIYDAAAIVEDQTYREREDIVTIDDDQLGPIRMQAVLPKLANHPGRIWRAGPELGADTDLVLREWLGLDDDELDCLRDSKAI